MALPSYQQNSMNVFIFPSGLAGSSANLAKDTTVVICNLSSHQTQYINNHYLADLQTCDGKSDKLFMDCITWVENIGHSTQCPELQLA